MKLKMYIICYAFLSDESVPTYPCDFLVTSLYIYSNGSRFTVVNLCNTWCLDNLFTTDVFL